MMDIEAQKRRIKKFVGLKKSVELGPNPDPGSAYAYLLTIRHTNIAYAEMLMDGNQFYLDDKDLRERIIDPMVSLIDQQVHRQLAVAK